MANSKWNELAVILGEEFKELVDGNFYLAIHPDDEDYQCISTRRYWADGGFDNDYSRCYVLTDSVLRFHRLGSGGPFVLTGAYTLNRVF